jgi:hypothetical protein
MVAVEMGVIVDQDEYLSADIFAEGCVILRRWDRW